MFAAPRGRGRKKKVDDCQRIMAPGTNSEQQQERPLEELALASQCLSCSHTLARPLGVVCEKSEHETSNNDHYLKRSTGQSGG